MEALDEKKKVERREMGEMKVNMKSVRAEGRKAQAK